jgi:5-methyltetrahydrofolate--homocysteine methyltransferase
VNFESLVEAIADLDYESSIELVKKYLLNNVPAREILAKGLSPGLLIVGERYEKGEYFLSELLFAAEIMQEATKLIEPKLTDHESQVSQVGIAIVGTVAGDLHDIGKNIFIMLMKASGFKVIDLGIDVPTKKFVEAIKEHSPDILGMSALLTTTAPTFKSVIDSLIESNLRNKLFIMIGGPPHLSAEESGADGYYNDAFKGVRAALEYIKIN